MKVTHRHSGLEPHVDFLRAGKFDLLSGLCVILALAVSIVRELIAMDFGEFFTSRRRRCKFACAIESSTVLPSLFGFELRPPGCHEAYSNTIARTRQSWSAIQARVVLEYPQATG